MSAAVFIGPILAWESMGDGAVGEVPGFCFSMFYRRGRGRTHFCRWDEDPYRVLAELTEIVLELIDPVYVAKEKLGGGE